MMPLPACKLCQIAGNKFWTHSRVWQNRADSFCSKAKALKTRVGPAADFGGTPLARDTYTSVIAWEGATLTDKAG